PNVQNGFYCLLRCLVGIVQPKADPWCCLHFTKYKFNVYRKKYIRSGRDSAVVGIPPTPYIFLSEIYKEWEGFRRSRHCRKIQKFRFSQNAYLLVFGSE